MSNLSHFAAAVHAVLVASAGMLTRVAGGSGAPAAGFDRSGASLAARRSDPPVRAARLGLLLGPVVAAMALLGLGVVPASADSCPNAAFRVGPSANLPDCRAYEQITPVDKEGGNDIFQNAGSSGIGTQGIAANDGDGALLLSGLAFGPDPNPGVGTFGGGYVFSRSPSVWQPVSANPPNSGDSTYLPRLFSPDLSRVALDSFVGSSADTSTRNIHTFVAGPPGGPYQSIVTSPTVVAPSGAQIQPLLLAATPDFSHILFQAIDHSLAPGAAGQVAGSEAVYEWTDGQLRLVNRNADGSLVSPCGAMLGNGNSGGEAHNAISSDGARVFFVSPDPNATVVRATDPSCSQPPHLYMRVNGGQPVDVSAPNPGVSDPNGFQQVAYVGAAADGSKVFFVTKTELTADDTTHDFELYEYDTASGTLTRVSRGDSGGADGNVQWAQVSDDGSTVYFAALGQLALGAPALAPPSAGGTQVNLYRYDTASGTTSYIATLPGVDGPRATGSFLNSFSGGFQTQSISNWYTTPDGRFLLFASRADLTGYDNGGVQELYRYDAPNSRLNCVSCNPSGAPATGSAEFTSVTQGIQTADTRPPQSLSDAGSRAFFDTPDRLLPQDGNQARDVYEWEADGSGSCQSTAQDGGCLYLISSGEDSLDALFVDSSSNGSNVLFGTHAQLAPTDTDFGGDLYDARVDGGFPPPPSPASCSGDACQGASQQPPAIPTAASVVFTGPGDAQPSAANTTAKPKVTLLTRAVRGASFLVRVKVSGRGRITISNASIKTVRRSVARAGTYALRVVLTPKARRALRHKRRLKLKLRVRYAPPGASASVASVSMAVKPAVRSSRHGRSAPEAGRDRGGAK